MRKRNLTTALETGYHGGSVSIFSDGRFVDGRTNNMREAKIDHLLDEISGLLRVNGRDPGDLGAVYYAVDNGSRIGLKIGESMVKGLATGLQIERVARDLFECILAVNDFDKRDRAILIAHGKNELEYRFYKKGVYRAAPPLRKIVNSPEARVFDENTKDAVIFAPLDHLKRDFGFIYEILASRHQEIFDLGENLSRFLVADGQVLAGTRFL